jgi:5-(carboxyamino)imidazole ribonucleotide synthase
MDPRTGLPIVGMVGGGQLARMTHQAAIALGQSLRVLAISPDDGAALVGSDVHIGHHADLDALRAFAKRCDVVTFDHEHVPGEAIRALAAEGVHVAPGADALRYAQDKCAMRERLAGLGIPVPRWAPVHGPDDVVRFAAGAPGRAGSAGVAGVGWPVVLKAVRGGYDGRGVWVADSPQALASLGALTVVSPGGLVSAGESAGAKRGGAAAIEEGTRLIVEERVVLRRELAALVARSHFGQVAAYPVVETVQRDGICEQVLAPAPGLDQELAVQAQELAIRLAVELGVVGLLAVELFDTGAGLLVNELAMRPHNSGHWTIEGARTSQFEQHLRAVLDYPLGETSLAAPAVAMVNVLGGPFEPAQPGPGGAGEHGQRSATGMSIDERLHHLFAADPAIKVHLYGKQVRPGRKIGHVTALGEEMVSVRERAARAARWLREGA